MKPLMQATTLEQTRRAEHPGCWVCGPGNQTGLRVDFRPAGEAGVEATFSCEEQFSGYTGFIHGGVVSSLLDGAMTNCLMARGTVSVTADLRIRFRKPVDVGVRATVRARLAESRHGLHVVEAELEQDGEVRATARGRFLAHPHRNRSARTH